MFCGHVVFYNEFIGTKKPPESRRFFQKKDQTSEIPGSLDHSGFGLQTRAAMNSRFIFAMNSTLMPLGQSNSQP